jgi:hypothetical protein
MRLDAGAHAIRKAGARAPSPTGAIRWESDDSGVSISRIEDGLPADVIVIKLANSAPGALSNLEILSSAEVDALFDDKARLKYQKYDRPVRSHSVHGRERTGLRACAWTSPMRR